MSPHQRILFTALPNGPDVESEGRFRLSVHVAPRLTNDGGNTVLSTFSDWTHWPAVLQTIGWSVAFGAEPPKPATVVSAPPRSDLWEALFGPSTVVHSHEYTPFDDNIIHSFPVNNVKEFIRDRYTKAATASPTEHPHIDDLTGSNGLGPLGNSGHLESTQLAQLQLNKAITNGPPLANPRGDFAQLRHFHKPRMVKDAPVPKPALDFHRAIATVGQHPQLMRLLGLVVDLAFDVGDSGFPPSPNEVRVIPAYTPTGPSSLVSVRTRCLIGPGTFRARPREEDPELADGALPFNDTARFTVVQEDVDGAAIKAVQLLENLLRIQPGGKKSSASPDNYALPALRSGGLGVARTNRAPAMHKRLGRGTATNDKVENDPDNVVVDAEDVVRGYRIDVRDEREARWFSLSARTGSYAFVNGGKVEPFSDEGFVSTVPTSGDGEKPDLYLQETLFRWGGWSLAASRPGGRIATSQEEDPPVTFEPNTPGDDFPVRIDTKATPGTLPRLRFGRTYRLRARVVDLAGNSEPLNPASEDRRASPPVTYGRFEPIQSPPVLLHSPRTESESLERVVLRSNWNSGPDPAVDVSRHIVPPKAVQLMAEQHGMFDTAYPNSVVNSDAYPIISAYPGVAPPDPDAPVEQSEQGHFALSSERVQDPDDYQRTFYYPHDLVSLPYLPDPIGAGAALQFLDLPGTNPETPLFAAFASGTAWPAYRPVRLRVRQGPNLPRQKPTFDAASRHIDVPLAKGDVVHVRLSAFLHPGDLDQLGMWQWIVAGGGIGLRQVVVEGRHWMITPYRTLTLVHAVRQPLALARFLEEPNGTDLGIAGRTRGQTYAAFAGTLMYSRKSTVQIDIISAWDEYVDRGPGTAKPAPVARRTVPFKISGDRQQGKAGFDSVPLLPASDRQEFGDTKRRKVSLSTVVTSRFSEYFTERKKLNVQYGGNPSVLVGLSTEKGLVPGSVAVKNQVVTNPDDHTITGSKTYTEGGDFQVDANAGTVRFLRPDGENSTRIPEGQSVVVTYLVPPFTRPDPGEPFTPGVVDIPSTARPSAPKLVYVVPTFGWETSKDGVSGTITSKRFGNGLRVYLERPWWSTGEGELLGVVLLPGNGSATPPNELNLNVTQWGVDPVFRGPATSGKLPTLGNFPKRVSTGLQLSLPGVPKQFKVDVAGHSVGFDEKRDLWYSDIEISTKAYFPFVRLALARFQPHSIVDDAEGPLHLSGVVLADFAQLAPNRSVTMFNSNKPNTKNIVVFGSSYDRAGAQNLKATVRVTVESKDPNVPGALGWSPRGSSTTLTYGVNPQDPTETRWFGEFKVPPPKPGQAHRVVIEEFEYHATGTNGIAQTSARLVYADVIDLSSGVISTP